MHSTAVNSPVVTASPPVATMVPGMNVRPLGIGIMTWNPLTLVTVASPPASLLGTAVGDGALMTVTVEPRGADVGPTTAMPTFSSNASLMPSTLTTSPIGCTVDGL